MDNKKNGIPKLRFPGFTGAWEQRKLVSLFSKFTDGDWIESKDQANTGIRLIQTGNIGITEFINKFGNEKWISEETFKKLNCEEIFPGDIIISRLPDPAGRACILPKLDTRMITAVDCTIARTSRETSAEFIVQYLSTQTYFKYVQSCLAGGTRQRISRKNLANFNVSIPTEINEQKQIGFFFKQLDTLIALHQRKLEHLQEQKKGLLQKMFPKNGEIVPEVRFPGFTDAWEQRKLGEVVEWSKGSGLSKNDLNIQGKGVPVIHYADLYKFNSVQKEVIHWTIDDMGTNIPENNLLFPMSDVTPDGLARTSTVLQSNVKAGGDVLIAKLNKDVLSPFMSYQVNRNKNQILPLVTGTTVRHISSKSLNSLKVSIPGKNEQKYIGSILMHFDTLIALHQRKLDHLELMKKGLLQQMFV